MYKKEVDSERGIGPRGGQRMRVNTKNVFTAWMHAKSCRKAHSLWTDGSVIYSYGTAIARMNSDGKVVFNVMEYSRTTSVHQNGLRSLFVGMPVTLTECENDVFVD